MTDEPLVSVAIVTYNHCAYITQAIESVLAQRRDFAIEIVISDDCSTDSTTEIVDSYQEKYPGLIRRLDPPENLGPYANFTRVWEACRGKYIAQLDGDDWWHSEDKLASQACFMEAHPECTVSGHRSRVIRDEIFDESASDRVASLEAVLVPLDLVLEGNPFATAAMMYRSGVVPTPPAWMKDFAIGDFPLLALHALRGECWQLPHVHSTHRLHTTGTWSSLQHHKRLSSIVGVRQKLLNFVTGKHYRNLALTISNDHFLLVYYHKDMNDSRAVRKHAWAFIRYSLLSGKPRLALLVKAAIWILLPKLKCRNRTDTWDGWHKTPYQPH